MQKQALQENHVVGSDLIPMLNAHTSANVPDLGGNVRD
jgi:hypothetical protein